MRSHLARSVWITNGLRVLQGVYHRCVTCTRYQARPSQQRMVPLPEDCVTPTRIFEVSGVDFAGPFALRMSKGPGSKRMKGYVCIFVCMLTKAVYIEVVTGLTVDDFLAAYSRFTGRRGVCRIIYSDNATTFKAASKELTRLLQEALQMKGGIVDAMAAQGTEWKFIPPRAPHHRGVWESAVRSFKFHLKRVVGNSHLTYEGDVHLGGVQQRYTNTPQHSYSVRRVERFWHWISLQNSLKISVLPSAFLVNLDEPTPLTFSTGLYATRSRVSTRSECVIVGHGQAHQRWNDSVRGADAEQQRLPYAHSRRQAQGGQRCEYFRSMARALGSCTQKEAGGCRLRRSRPRRKDK
ncbi:unnamed protein product [Trichogramma brassicae]|uniref:Integrase catalytic domain-containing protein n=1 Tax=Trichogramma brassicae TaxID=86971 RepID=A0A6H5IT86_9HYME|nr:unnamed protein product [Trichogramma brassicae]